MVLTIVNHNILCYKKMKCPYCLSTETKVVDKREADEEQITRRRRECLKCGKRFTTYERVEVINLAVIKKDGRVEPFDREKLKLGILKACEKRPIEEEILEKIVNYVESRAKRRKSLEIKTSQIGEMVVKKLKALDEVAYMRFTSVYKQFNDLSSFRKELKNLQNQR